MQNLIECLCVCMFFFLLASLAMLMTLEEMWALRAAIMCVQG